MPHPRQRPHMTFASAWEGCAVASRKSATRLGAPKELASWGFAAPPDAPPNDVCRCLAVFRGMRHLAASLSRVARHGLRLGAGEGTWYDSGMQTNPKTWTADARALPTNTPLSAEEVLEKIKAAAGDDFLDGSLAPREEADSGDPAAQVRCRFRGPALRRVVEALLVPQYPHLSVIAAVDCGETIELPYVFALFSGAGHDAAGSSPDARRSCEVRVIATAVVPKSDPVIDTISDLVPGALFSEREKQEMIGVKVKGIPDPRRLFLPDDVPEGVYPWRKDETGIPPEMVRELWKTGRGVADGAAPPEA